LSREDSLYLGKYGSYKHFQETAASTWW